MKSKATTIDEYLAELPDDRRDAVEAVRKVILKNLPDGYEEVLQYGMLGYVVPLTVFPAGYLNRKNEPVPYVCLASQKNYMSIYLMSVYGPGEAEFRKAYATTGKKIDMGKSCIRFKKVDDLALDVIGKAVAKWPMKKWIAMCETAWKDRKR
jgi:uncharacterized protein YdhG (YjbR/CyaY superfamily)